MFKKYYISILVNKHGSLGQGDEVTVLRYNSDENMGKLGVSVWLADVLVP